MRDISNLYPSTNIQDPSNGDITSWLQDAETLEDSDCTDQLIAEFEGGTL